MDKKLKQLGINKKDLAEKLGVHAQTVSSWSDIPPKYVDTFLDALLEIQKLNQAKAALLDDIRRIREELAVAVNRAA